MRTSDRASVLLVGSGYENFRGYLLEGLAQRSDILLLDSGPITWQVPFIVEGRTVDCLDAVALLRAATEVVRDRPVHGVLTWEEKLLVPTSVLAAALDVPALPVPAALLCRDKASQRAALARAGVPSARWHLTATPADAVAAAADIGYPVVVKPRSAAGSRAVQLVSDDRHVGSAFVLAREKAVGYGGSAGGVLVEEFLRGPELSVDSWVLGGEVVPCVFAAKRLGPRPFFTELGHVVPPSLAADVTDSVAAVVAEASRALGVDRVITHTEVVLTPSGPRIVEVNGRVGGDLIPYLGQMAQPGFSMGAAAGAVACGERPPPTPAAVRTVGIRFLQPSRDLVFDRLRIPAEVADVPGIERIQALCRGGETLLLPPGDFLGRAGYCIVTGGTVEELDDRMDHVARMVDVIGRTLLPEPRAEDLYSA